MIGYHAVSLIADAYTKGYRNFDVQKAYKASLRAAEYDTTGIKCPDWMIPYVMPKARYYKNAIGYVPCDKDNEAVAKALEYAYDDWCIAVLAKELGDSANYQKYQNLPKVIRLIMTSRPGSCADSIHSGSGVNRSIRTLPITGMMTIAKGMPGNGAGSFRTIRKG